MAIDKTRRAWSFEDGVDQTCKLNGLPNVAGQRASLGDFANWKIGVACGGRRLIHAFEDGGALGIVASNKFIKKGGAILYGSILLGLHRVASV